MNYILLLLIAIFSLGGLCGCTKENKRSFAKLEDFNKTDIRIGGELGSFALRAAQEKIPQAKFEMFVFASDAYPALITKKIDAIVCDRPALEYVVREHHKFKVLDVGLAQGHVAVGGTLHNTKLMNKVNEFIKEYRANGTYEEMYERWVKSDDPQMPDIPYPEHPVGTIVFGTDGENTPMSYLGNGDEVVGFDVELAKRLGLYLNMDYKIKVMDYEALFPACEAGKVDLVLANINATDERKETMLFSDEYIDSPVALLILKENYHHKTHKK